MMPEGQIAIRFDVEHNLLRICGIDRDGTGFVYTDVPAKSEIEEGDEEYLAKDLVYWPCFMWAKRQGIVDLAKEIDSPDLTIEWSPAEDKITLRWKVEKRKRQATIEYTGQPFPPVPTFSYETAVTLPPDVRKVFNTHNAVCKSADEPKYEGYWLSYTGTKHDKQPIAFVRSTDKIRMLETEIEIGLPDKEGDHHFNTAFPLDGLKVLAIRTETIRYDYEHAVFQISVPGNGNPIVLVRAMTKEDLPTFDVQKTASRTMFDESGPPPPHSNKSKLETSHFAVKGDGLKNAFHIAGLLTDESRLAYLTPMDVHHIDGWTGFLQIESLYSENGHATTFTELYPIDSAGNKVEGQAGLKNGLSFALVKTVFGLIDNDHYVHIHAHPRTPCVFIWGTHTFVVMPMVKREEKTADAKE
jgi:hypothetical protein